MLFFLNLAGFFIIIEIPLGILAHKNFPAYPRSLRGKLFLSLILVWILSIGHEEIYDGIRVRSEQEAGNIHYHRLGWGGIIL